MLVISSIACYVDLPFNHALKIIVGCCNFIPVDNYSRMTISCSIRVQTHNVLLVASVSYLNSIALGQ